MQKAFAFMVLLAVGFAVPLPGNAQGRHDEKPHGVMKESTNSAKSGSATGGRHDEGATSHAKKKSAASKKKTEDKEQAQTSTK